MVGNVVDPLSVIEGGGNQKENPAYGADTLRLWVSGKVTFYFILSYSILYSIPLFVKSYFYSTVSYTITTSLDFFLHHILTFHSCNRCIYIFYSAIKSTILSIIYLTYLFTLSPPIFY